MYLRKQNSRCKATESEYFPGLFKNNSAWLCLTQQVYQIELSCRNIDKESFLPLAQYKEPPIRRCRLRAVDIFLLGRAATFQSELLNVNKFSPQRRSLPSLFTGLAFPLRFPFPLLKVSTD